MVPSRRADRSGFREFLALVGGICHQPSIINHLENEIACGRDGSAANAPSAGCAPSFFLRDRIPRDKHSSLSFWWSWSDSRERLRRICGLLLWCGSSVIGRSRSPAIPAKQTRIGTAGYICEVLVHCIRAAAAGRGRNVDQTGSRVERHRRPVVSATRAGLDGYSVVIVIVVCFRIDDRPAGFLVDTFRPGDRRERLSGDERARYAIEHIEEAVLVGLHDDFSLAVR